MSLFLNLKELNVNCYFAINHLWTTEHLGKSVQFPQINRIHEL